MMKKQLTLPILSTALFLLCSHGPALAMIAGGCGTACINVGNSSTSAAGSSHDLGPYLWRQLWLVAIFYLSGYFFGRLVESKKLSVSLSRKLVCILTFAASYTNSLFTPAFNTLSTILLIVTGTTIILGMLASLTAPLRRRFPALRTVFSALNRPEDEPYTLMWLATEAVVTSLIVMVFIPVIGYVSRDFVSDHGALVGMMLIPIFASGIGDALAEIVGKKWGRHHYKTHSIFTKRVYTRSLEGSAMVFLTTLAVGLIVAAQSSFLMPVFFWKAFILLPVTLTLAEAKSPHTWDNPLLYLVGYLTIVLCLMA